MNKHIDPGSINRDRVGFDQNNTQILVTRHQLKPEERLYQENIVDGGYSYYPYWDMGIEWKKRLALWGTAASLILGNLGVNLSKETEKTAQSLQVSKGALENDMNNIGVRTKTDLVQSICDTVDWHFEHRFFTKDAQGVESFNWGALMIPFQYVSTEGCKVKGDLKLDVDAVFAPTFQELATANPHAQELRDTLRKHIQKALQDQLVVYGIPGTTDSLAVYNKSTGILTTGQNGVIDINLPISRTTFTHYKKTSSASTESAVGNNPKDLSIQGVNIENKTLAENRLNYINPIFDQAMRNIGAPDSIINSATLNSIEYNLSTTESTKFADGIRKAFPGIYSVVQTNDEVIFDFVQKANAQNPATMHNISQNKDLNNLYRELFVEKRSMSMLVNIDQKQKTTTIHPISIALPLFLLFLVPGVRRFPRGAQRVRTLLSVTPAEFYETETRLLRPVSRRIFDSNQTLTDSYKDIQKPLSFDKLFDEYESIFGNTYQKSISDNGEKHTQISDLNNAMDKHIMLSTLLADEVFPEFLSPTENQEPYIDYVKIIVDSLPRFRSERNNRLTMDDAIRAMSWDLVNMWQEHDEKVNPMKKGPQPGVGHDLPMFNKLDYRHSPYIVAYARLLAEEFALMIQEIESSGANDITAKIVKNYLTFIAKQGRYIDIINDKSRNHPVHTTYIQNPEGNTGAVIPQSSIKEEKERLGFRL